MDDSNLELNYFQRKICLKMFGLVIHPFFEWNENLNLSLLIIK